MPQLKPLVRPRSDRRPAKDTRPPGQALSPDELAMLRARGRAVPAMLSNGGLAALVRQIGNRAAGAYVARVPGDEDLDALLGGGPTAAQAPSTAVAAPPPPETAPAAEPATAAGPEEAGAAPPEAAGAPTAAEGEQPAAPEAKPTPPVRVLSPVLPPRNITGGGPQEGLVPAGPVAGVKPPAGAFEPKKQPWPPKPGAAGGQPMEGGLKGPGAISRPEAVPAIPAAPSTAAGMTPSTQTPAVGAAAPAPAGATAEAAPAAPETTAATGQTPVEAETNAATRTAETQGATQAESAGQAVTSEAQTAGAGVEEATAEAQATEAEAPAAAAAEREPSWMDAARQTLQRVLGYVSDRARQALHLVDGLGTRIVDLARQGVQAATNAIRTAGAMISGSITRLLATLSSTISALVSRAQGVAREIREAAGRAVNWVLSLMGDVGERIRNGVTSFLQGAYRRLAPMVRNMRLGAERALATLTNYVVSAIRQRGQQLRQMVQRLLMQITERIRLLRLAIRTAIELLLNGEPPAPEAAARWVRERLRRVGLPPLQALGQALTRAARAAGRGVREALRAIVDPLASAYRSAAGFMRMSLAPILEGAREYAPEIVQEAEIGAGQGESAVQTIGSAIDAEGLSTEAAAQEGVATLASEINTIAEV